MASQTRTEEGLRLASWSLLLYFIVGIIGLAGSTAFVVLAAIGGLDFSTVVLLGAAIGAPTSILTLILVILFLIGFFTLRSHRREFGPVHEKNLDRSFLLFIAIMVAFVTMWLIFFVLFFLAFMSFIFPFDPNMPPTQPTTEQLQEALLPAILVAQGLDIFVAFLVAFFLYLIVIALLSPSQEFHLKMAVTLFTLGPVASLVTFVILYLSGNLLVPAFQDSGNFIFPPLEIQYRDILGGLLKSSLQAAGAFLFWRVYQAAYVSVRGTAQAT